MKKSEGAFYKKYILKSWRGSWFDNEAVKKECIEPDCLPAV